MPDSALPPLAALFLVTFDQKIGYVLSWSRSSPKIDLAGVEFKALPSGVHEVESDTIYFSHKDYIGVNAFARTSSTAEQRNAAFIGVGALVEQAGARLGSIWQHIPSLHQLAQAVTHDEDKSAPLEEFWKMHQPSQTRSASSWKQSGARRPQGLVTELEIQQDSMDESKLAAHPVITLKQFVSTFGPLIFQIQRAILLRKRILLLGHAPVHQMCQFVYNMSLLGLLSAEAGQTMLSQKELPPHQLLFNVGIADIDQLSSTRAYIACTTDSILADKRDLYDIIIRLPQTSATGTSWPSLHESSGRQVKATERDALRYCVLTQQLDFTSDHYSQPNELDGDLHSAEDDEEPLLVPGHMTTSSTQTNDSTIAPDLLETRTWKGAAYMTLAKWTNPDTIESREATIDHDATLLTELSAAVAHPQAAVRDVLVVLELFRHLNSRILEGLTELSKDAQDAENTAEEPLLLSPVDVHDLGLDMYSTADRTFVEEASLLYQKRAAKVIDDGVRLCGIRIC